MLAQQEGQQTQCGGRQRGKGKSKGRKKDGKAEGGRGSSPLSPRGERGKQRQRSSVSAQCIPATAPACNTKQSQVAPAVSEHEHPFVWGWSRRLMQAGAVRVCMRSRKHQAAADSPASNSAALPQTQQPCTCLKLSSPAALVLGSGARMPEVRGPDNVVAILHTIV